MQMKKVFYLFILLFFFNQAIGQKDKDKAESFANEAVELLQNDNPKKAYKKLKKAVKFDSENIAYQYQLSYAYFSAEEFNESLETLNGIIDQEKDNAMVYELMGNNYVMLDEFKNAEESYLSGLNKFPNEGVLYEELGNLAMMDKDYEEALLHFEKGILKSPSYPSNYYKASKIYCSSTEEVWGLIYGEIFMNLERNTERTKEISELLFNTLKNGVEFHGDSSISVNICQHIDDSTNQNDSLSAKSFGQRVVEPNMLKSFVKIDTVTLENIDRMRKSFIHHYYLHEDTFFPRHQLFEFHKDLIKHGHFEAYNYWLFMMGDVESFKKWEKDNKSQWIMFLDWYKKNELQLTNESAFHKDHF